MGLCRSNALSFPIGALDLVVRGHQLTQYTYKLSIDPRNSLT